MARFAGSVLARKRRTTIASWTALSVAAASLVAFAVAADGQKTHRAELNDAGVWVTNQDQGILGRQNKSIDQLDANVPASLGGGIDVLQDGNAVISVDDVNGTVTPVNPSLGTAPDDGLVSVAGEAVMGGGTVAVIDKKSGGLWATRVDPQQAITGLSGVDSESKPMMRVGGDAVIATSSSGTVFAVAADKKRVAVIAPSGTAFAKPTKADLARVPADGVIQVTTVGETPIVLDGTGRVITERGSAVVGKAGAVSLQASGPDAGEVLVATTGGLKAVDLETFKIREIAGEVSGEPTRPVKVGGCAFAAWATGTDGHIVAACDDAKVQGPSTFPLVAGADLKFRVNRNQVLLNDVKHGTVWEVEGGVATDISDWESLQPQDEQEQDSEQDSQAPQLRQPPQANPDKLGAKAGRTTTLHVLDNDKVSGKGVLSIVSVKGLDDEPGAQLQLSPDRQSVLLTVAAEVRRNLSFQYTVSDGTGGKDSTDEADVSVNIVDEGCSAAPILREGAAKDRPTYPLAAGGYLEVSVLSEWRDPNCGDPVSLDDVPPSAEIATTVTPEGLLRVRAPRSAGVLRVDYSVSTGGAPASDSLSVKVLAAGSIETVAPQGLPDVASGEVDSPIIIKPLDNDIPGADPTDPQAKLVLAGKVAPQGGLAVSTDLESGSITVRAKKPGLHILKYSAGFGSAKRSAATDIRVVVDGPSEKSNLPIAAPDTTTVRGMSPMLIDVLANDYDAKGRLLAVQHARPMDPDGGLEVAVVDGHWLRISATTTEIKPVTQAIEYSVSNGDASANGTVTVTQKGPLPSEQNSPVPEPDQVSVRVGDSVLVPVLENDSTPSGDPVGLVTDQTAKFMGELTVLPEVGKAYVSGRNIRYVAPAGSADLPPSVQVSYVVQNMADPEASPQTGVLTVRLSPKPSETNPNQAPTPRAIEGRVVEGDVTSLKLPLVGNDPDGDSISVVALGSAPKLGRVLALGANAISYQAFPGSTGTDEFSYVVTDKYGARAEGAVRVAVTPPGAPQAPVAVGDAVTADLGARIQIDVLGNDLRSPGAQLKIRPLEGAPEGVTLVSDTGPVRLTASDDPKRKIVFAYRVTNGLDESVGEVVVTSVKDYNNPPVLVDSFSAPKPDASSVEVDVLKRAYDIDGGEPLLLESVGGADGSDSKVSFTPKGVVTLPVLEVPQIVPFRVADAGGAVSAASIFVPAKPIDTPYLRPDAVIELKPGQTKDIPLKNLVADPEGDAVVLTLVDSIQAAPSDNLTAEAPPSADTLRLTAGRRAGPGAVTFEVSDRTDLADLTAHKAYISVPVQVGSKAPILNCPDQDLTVVEGGRGKSVDVASICHVWTSDPANARSLTYSAAWEAGKQPTDVEVRDAGGGIQLIAGVNAVRDARGTLRVSARGFESTGRLNVRVVAAGPPSLSSMSLDTEKGKAVELNIKKYAKSPFGSDAKWAVTGVEQISGPRLLKPPVVDGVRVTFEPKDDSSAYGTYRFRITVADDGGASGSKRPTASAIATLSVVTEPSPPTNLRWNGERQNEQVTLNWNAPPANGGTINRYTVTYEGGSTTCPSAPCTIRNVKNGKEYTFTVTATNAFGESAPSNSATGVADRVPDHVEALTVTKQRDREVRLTWRPPVGAGSSYSAIKEYYVSWPGGGVNSAGTATSYTARGVANGDDVTFTVWGRNDAESEPAGSRSSVNGMGAGKPDAPETPSARTENVAGSSSKAITVSWGQVGANGPDPVTYTVTRSGNGSKTICEWVAATQCTDDVSNDGTSYEYRVQARNAEAVAGREEQPSLHVSALSAPVKVEAAATPETPTFDSAQATGENGKVSVQFDVGPSHGKANRIECSPNCLGVGAAQPVAGASNLQATVDFGGPGANGSARSMRMRTCNDSTGSGHAGDTCSAWVNSPPATPYGPIGAVTVNASANGSHINWSVGVDPNGRSVRVRLQAQGFDQQWTTGNGTYGNSGSIDVGYGQTRNFTLTVTDTDSPARAQRSASAQATTPVPPPVVRVSAGANAQGLGACTVAKCRFVVASTSNFSGNVTCQITAAAPTGTVGFVAWSQGGNQANYQSPNYFGGNSITVRCSGGGQTAEHTTGWLP